MASPGIPAVPDYEIIDSFIDAMILYAKADFEKELGSPVYVNIGKGQRSGVPSCAATKTWR